MHADMCAISTTAEKITRSSNPSLISKLDFRGIVNDIRRRNGVNIALKRTRRRNLKQAIALSSSSVSIAGAVERKSTKKRPDLKY